MKSDVAEPLLYDDEDDVGIQPRPSVSSSHCYDLFQRGVTIVTMGLAFLCIISLSAVILHLQSRLNQIRYESDLVPSTSKHSFPTHAPPRLKQPPQTQSHARSSTAPNGPLQMIGTTTFSGVNPQTKQTLPGTMFWGVSLFYHDPQPQPDAHKTAGSASGLTKPHV